MRGLAHLKRSTMVSKAWMPNARPQCRCQAPQPRSGAPKAQGLIGGTADAAQSALPSIALPCSAPPQMILHRGRRTHGASASMPNLHQLDGRDLRHGLSRDEYLRRWGLRTDHLLTAPAYSERRSALARALGLGKTGKRGGRAATSAAAPLPGGPDQKSPATRARKPRSRSWSKLANVMNEARPAPPPGASGRRRSLG